MAKYKTLDEWLLSGRGDGRKFTHYSFGEGCYFEPFFKDELNYWHGLKENSADRYNGHDAEWTEWHPPKKMKKIKMYRAVFRMVDGHYITDTSWSSSRNYSCALINLDSSPPIYYEEREIEVPDDGSK